MDLSNNNQQQTSFYNSATTSIANQNSVTVVSTNHIIDNVNNNFKLQNSSRKLENTPSTRTISSADNWCSEIAGLQENDYIDDTSSFNEEDDNVSERSNSLLSSSRNSQLRLTFNKFTKQHLSFDKWRNHNSSNPKSSNNSLNTSSGNVTMPTSSSNNTESTGESLSRLSRWFSIRRGSTHQYEINANSAEHGDNADKSQQNEPKLSTGGRKMPGLQEVKI